MKIGSSHLLRPVLLAVALAAVIGGDWHPLLRLSYNNARTMLLSYRCAIPVLSVLFLWLDRKKIVSSVGEPSAVGLVLLVPCLIFGWMGEQGQQIRFEIIGFLGSVLTLVWAFFGSRTAKAVLYPVLYLALFLYFETWMATGFVLPRIMTAATTGLVGLLFDCAGMDVVRQTGQIVLADLGQTIDTAQRDFGISEKTPAIILSATYAFFAQPTTFRRLLLVAATLPCIIVSNAILICAAVLLPSLGLPQLGPQTTRLSILAVCGLLMAATSCLITKGAKRCARS